MLFYKTGKPTADFLPKQRIQVSSAWAMVEVVCLYCPSRETFSNVSKTNLEIFGEKMKC
jgi:hypothetical protein